MLENPWILSRPVCSRSPVTLAYDFPEGPYDYPEVKMPGSPLNIFKIKSNPLLEIDVGPTRSTDLPQSGESRLDAEPGLTPGRAELIFRIRTGSRADQIHVALEHIIKLGEFIKMESPEELANPQQAGIFWHMELRTIRRIGVLEPGLQ